jgi:uncharacterized protein (TIGR00369 family)
MEDQRASGEIDELTHTPEELLTHYHNAMRGHPVAALEMDEYSVQRIVVRARFEHDHTRPGGMVSGPNLFTLADAMAYFVTMSRSPRGSQAYTASISMEFLSPAPVGVLFVEGRLLRFGRRSSVVDTLIRCPERDEPIAHAVVTYAPVFPERGQIST